MILSISRRTDIPAFYTPWLLERLRAGEVVVGDPYAPGRFRRILFSPDTIDALVMWSKAPAPLLQHLDELQALGYGRLYVQYTLNAYGAALEPGVPPLEARIETFLQLSRRLGPQRVVWRYDPIVLSPVYTPEWHLQAFAALARRLGGHTARCTISFLDPYPAMRARCAGLGLTEPTGHQMRQLAGRLVQVAAPYGLKLYACCEHIDLREQGVEPAACIDRALIEGMCGSTLRARPDPGQRPGCGCCESMDIGAYDTCLHGCLYCYATRQPEVAQKNFLRHPAHAPYLGPAPDVHAVVRTVHTVRLATGQTSLFLHDT